MGCHNLSVSRGHEAFIFLLGGSLIVTFILVGGSTPKVSFKCTVVGKLFVVLFEKKIRFVLTPKNGSEKASWEDVVIFCHRSRFLKATHHAFVCALSRICKVSCQCLGADKPPKGGAGRGCKGDLVKLVSWVSFGRYPFSIFWM